MAATAVLSKVKAITQDPANVPAALKLGFAKVMVKAILTSDLDDSDLLLSLECACNCVKHQEGLAAVRSSDSALAPRLDFIANHGMGRSKVVAAEVLAAVNQPSAAATSASTADSTKAAPRPASSTAKKTKALKVSMKGAMGGKQAQDAYVEAILLLPGVTSVTIDTTKDKIVVYTSEAGKVKPQLAGAIREVRARFGLSAATSGSALGPSSSANAYYGDEDEDEEYERSSKNTITDNAGVETVEARMARKRRARAAAKGGENQGIMGAVASVGSWLWG